MKKYKLNSDKKSITPSNESVKKQKDFGKLFYQYEKYTKRPKKPLYKDPKVFLFLVIASLLVYIIFTEINKDKKEEIKKEQVEK